MAEKTSPTEPAGGAPAEPTVRVSRRYEFFTELINEFAASISGAGMFVRTADPPEPGTPVEFDFKLGGQIDLLSGRGEVVWVRERSEAGQPAGMAVRFLRFGASGDKVIRRLLEANAQRGGEPFVLGEEYGEGPAAAPRQDPAPAPATRDAEAARAAASALEAELAAAREEIARRAARERELEGLEARLVERGTELEEARAEVDGARREVEGLEAALAESSRELEGLERRYGIKAENERALAEDMAKLERSRDDLQAELTAREAETAWLRSQLEPAGAAPEAGPPPAPAAPGLVEDLERELAEARATIASIQQAAREEGRRARPADGLVPARRRGWLGAALTALVGVVIGALLAWQIGPWPSGPVAPAGPEKPRTSPAAAADGADRAREIPVAPAAGEPAPAGEAPAAGGESPDPRAAVAGWAAAWSEQRVEDYLGFYAASFEPAAGAGREAWEAERRRRLQRPSFIRVTVGDVRLERLGPERVRARFDQAYESDTYSDRVVKVLDLILEDGRWKIAAERAG